MGRIALMPSETITAASGLPPPQTGVEALPTPREWRRRRPTSARAAKPLGSRLREASLEGSEQRRDEAAERAVAHDENDVASLRLIGDSLHQFRDVR